MHLSDREKQTVIAALESFRSRKQAAIISAPKGSTIAQELRLPENEFDILSAEHSLMHAITVLAHLTAKPVAYFTNPNPSQLPQPKTHTEGPGHVPMPNQPVVNSLEEAEKFFLDHSEGSCLCTLPTGTALTCYSYPEAKAFYDKP